MEIAGLLKKKKRKNIIMMMTRNREIACERILVQSTGGACDAFRHVDTVAVPKQNMSSFYWRRQGGRATRDVVGGACLR